MSKTSIQKAFYLFRKTFPPFVWRPIRSISTAILTPIRFSIKSGHFKSSLLNKAVNNRNQHIPWYSYPAIDLLVQKNFNGKSVLEFGAGQSTIWWAKRADSVTAFEGNVEWYDAIKSQMPPNVHLFHARENNLDECMQDINNNLSDSKKFDVIIIDGLYRFELCKIAIKHLAEGGLIIADNSEEYNFQQAFQNTDFQRVDFYGYSPGVVLKQGTSIFFREKCFIFSPKTPIQLEL